MGSGPNCSEIGPRKLGHWHQVSGAQLSGASQVPRLSCKPSVLGNLTSLGPNYLGTNCTRPNLPRTTWGEIAACNIKDLNWKIFWKSCQLLGISPVDAFPKKALGAWATEERETGGINLGLVRGRTFSSRPPPCPSATLCPHHQLLANCQSVPCNNPLFNSQTHTPPPLHYSQTHVKLSARLMSSHAMFFSSPCLQNKKRMKNLNSLSLLVFSSSRGGRNCDEKDIFVELR